jgi:hypothetical protein
MRGPDSEPLAPEIEGALMAMDATLAGEPVDPEYAELAELALILRRESPRTSDTFAASLDDRVQRRFARPAPAARGTGLRRRWLGPMAGLVAAAAGAAVVIVVAGSGGGRVVYGASSSVAASAGTSSSAASAAASTSASGGVAGPAAPAKRAPTIKPMLKPHSAGSTSGAAASSPSGNPTVPSPVVPGNRQVVQSAQLTLSASPNRIDDVAQQVFNVVGDEKGYVDSSNVTAGGRANSGAYFQLSVPSDNLTATLTSLSQLRGAHVVSRTDQTNDITGEVGGAGQKLAEARALRRSLLKQLANATTSQQVASIQAQLHDANASIASDLSKLRGLQRQVAYSRISVNIEVSPPPAPVTHHSSGFTIGKAAHDAGRVLVVVAGVGLIVLAVMVPVGLVAALIAWVAFAVRRRRREQALDLV